MLIERHSRSITVLGVVTLAPGIRVNAICRGCIDTPRFEKGRYGNGTSNAQSHYQQGSTSKSVQANRHCEVGSLLAGSASNDMTDEMVRIDAGFAFGGMTQWDWRPALTSAWVYELSCERCRSEHMAQGKPVLWAQRAESFADLMEFARRRS